MIPNTAHFVWLGNAFPWVYGLALRSAALRGGFNKVVLHHTDALSDTPGWRAMENTERIAARRLNARDYLGQTDSVGTKLCHLYNRLDQPTAKSNLLRVAILAREGGVYLDTDIITVRSFEPLLNTGVFCGVERIALPANLIRSRLPHRWLAAFLRIAVRDLLRRLPSGWRMFKKIERLYPAVVNNAVLGAAANHPFLFEMLERMLAKPECKQLKRFALGTRLLEDTTASYRGDDLTLHPPRRFYPLGPEISAHWFRYNEKVELKEIIHPDTVCVHWYASVRTKKHLPIIDDDFVANNTARQLFSRLAAASLSEGEGNIL
ncbi:MAG: glycosyl transferase [Proteobacteria bacterium]|nr:glycosyl transferase [Pseudomonadota bacterium]